MSAADDPIAVAVLVLRQMFRRHGPEYDAADEQIALWIIQGITSDEAWMALGNRCLCTGWGTVREFMVRWNARHAAERLRRAA